MSATRTWFWLCLYASLAAGCAPMSPCDCASEEESGAREVFEQGSYDFSHADADSGVREGKIELDAEEAIIEYRGPDGRMYRAIYEKGALVVNKF